VAGKTVDRDHPNPVGHRVNVGGPQWSMFREPEAQRLQLLERGRVVEGEQVFPFDFTPRPVDAFQSRSYCA
jgi:hypothetical protein